MKRQRVVNAWAPPVELVVTMPGTMELDPQTTAEYRVFLQSMADRRVQGGVRYGDRPTTKQKYMKRLGLEFAAYRRTGNVEHLFNIANYAFLETVAPQHPNQHWNDAVESATRGQLGGNIA